MSKGKCISGLVVLCFVLLLLLSGCETYAKKPITSLELLGQPGVKIAVGLDTPEEPSLVRDYPDAEVIPYTDMFLAYKDVASGKIDACIHARREMELAIQNGMEDVSLLEENYDANIIGVGISPVSDIPNLEEKLNAFIAEKKADGTLDDMYNRWVVLEDDTMPELPQPENPAYTICVGTTGTVMPYSYYKGTELVGYDIELAYRFAAWLGAGLEFKVYDFSGIIPAAQAGSVDCIMSNLYYTPEKDESIPFSDPLFEVGITAMVRDTTKSSQDTAGIEAFFSKMAESFEKTFIREARWQLFVTGVINTMIITLLSILLGTLLGFMVFMLYRKAVFVPNLIIRFSLRLVQGMPIVVLLMIIYYVIFGNVTISGIAVAVIGFTVMFGAGVFQLLKMGVGTVEKGQYEAAYALGYSKLRAFFKIILPQALPHMMPAYKGQVVELIKATSVVGFIAVKDITKMGDIVRSRTYEAFFPLIAVAVIYFVLEGLIGFAVSRMDINLDPKRRKREDILKGIKPDD